MTPASTRLSAMLNDLFLLAVLLIMAAILTAAMVLQYHDGEIPCPLCLLQRVAMFGICFGIIAHFREGYSLRNDGLSMLFALFLLIVASRQTLLDIYPRAGHAYIGSAVFGLHMPVWSVIIAVAVLLAYAIKFAVLPTDNFRIAERPARLNRLTGLLGFYVIILCAINFLSVIVQCGMGECHTFGYKLLSIDCVERSAVSRCRCQFLACRFACNHRTCTCRGACHARRDAAAKRNEGRRLI